MPQLICTLTACVSTIEALQLQPSKYLELDDMSHFRGTGKVMKVTHNASSGHVTFMCLTLM